MATKLEKMKAAMFACGVDEAIVNMAVENAESKKQEPKPKGKHSGALALFAPDEYEIVAAFESRFWPAYPQRKGAAGKAEARTKFVAIVKAGGSMEKIIDAAAQLAKDWAPRIACKPDEARFIPMAAVWLNKRRFEDGPEMQSSGSPSMLDIAHRFGGQS